MSSVLWCAGSPPAVGGEPEPQATEDPRPDPDADPGAYFDYYSRGFRLDSREFTFTQRYFWRRLFNPTGRDRTVGAGLLMGAAVLAGGKRGIQSEVEDSDTPRRHVFFEGVQKLGDQGVVPALALAFYLGGSTFGGYRAKETGMLLGQSALLTALMTGAGQFALNEDRPREGGAIHPFRGVGHGISGHSSTSASIAGVLSRMYLKIEPDDSRAERAWKRVGKGFAYGTPILVGLARVNEQQHFAYNSLLGVGIGFWVGNVVVDAHESYLQGADTRRWKPQAVGPMFDENGNPGIGARWEF